MKRAIALVLAFFAATPVVAQCHHWSFDWRTDPPTKFCDQWDNNARDGSSRRGDYGRRDQRRYRNNDRPIISTGGAIAVAGGLAVFGVVSSVSKGKSERHVSDNEVEIERIRADRDIKLANSPRAQTAWQLRSEEMPGTSANGAGPARKIDSSVILHVEIPESMRCFTAVNTTGHDLMISIEEKQTMGVLNGEERSYCSPSGRKISDIGAYQWRGAREGTHVHFSDDPVDFRLEQKEDDPYVRIIFFPLGGE